MRAHAAAIALSAFLALLLPLAVLAKEGGLVTLATPIPRDAQPGSTLTVTFTVTVPDENGAMVPFGGSPMVLKLIGPDGTTTEALGAERGTRGTYTAQIRVPASGIESAVFGIRGTSTMADGTTAIEDLPFDIDGLLFTTTAHPAPAAAQPAAVAPSSEPVAADARLPITGILGVLFGVAGLALAVLGRRRSLRSA
jgi:hypothetical protein